MKKLVEKSESIENIIAHNLINYRKSKNQTQAEFAEYCGISLYRLKRLESGQANPTIGSLIEIAGRLGCTTADLVTDEYFK